MHGAETAKAMKAAILFFRQHNVALDTIRMDNQSSPEVKQLAIKLNLQCDLVSPYQKEPNRAERAIRTALHSRWRGADDRYSRRQHIVHRDIVR